MFFSISWCCGSNYFELVRNIFVWIKIKNLFFVFFGEIKLVVDDDCKKIFEFNEKYLVVCCFNWLFFFFVFKLIENKILFLIKDFFYLKNFIIDCK